MGVSTFFLLLIMVVEPGLAVRAALALMVWCASALAALRLSRWGRPTAGSWLLIGATTTLVTTLAYFGQGVGSPALGSYCVIVLMAGLLLGEAASVATGFACGLAALGLVYLETTGRLPSPRTVFVYSPATYWLLNARWITVTVILTHLAHRAQRAALRRAETDLAERERLVRDLGERVKELQLLHGAAGLLRDRPFERDVLAELVGLMPGGWMYSECCEARIVYQGLEVTTAGWRETPWRQSAPFGANGKQEGMLEVAYTEERPYQFEGPFLAEERALIDSVAEMLGTYLQRQEAERQRQTLEGQLRQAQKMEALGTLAGGIAHDFNNILTAIGGNVELAQQEVAPGSLLSEYLESIGSAHLRARDLVQRILLFSRGQEPERRVIQLEEVVEEALKLLRSSLPPMIETRASYAPGLPPISADPTQIHQIIMNLGTNAAHAMHQGGGILSVEVSAVQIDEIQAPSPDLHDGLHVCVSVEDTGPGMDREVLDRLFEPFFTTKGLKGTGLGLSVVHGIVREHGGAITVYSELGRGSRFDLYFPVARGEAYPMPANQTRLLEGAGQHILYVDDEKALVALMSKALGRLGYKCTGFSDAREALDAFSADPQAFDAVLTDMAMPALTGLDLARALTDIRPDTPIAIVSGYGDEDTQALRSANIRVRIRKPFTIADLSQGLGLLLTASSASKLGS